MSLSINLAKKLRRFNFKYHHHLFYTRNEKKPVTDHIYYRWYCNLWIVIILSYYKEGVYDNLTMTVKKGSSCLLCNKGRKFNIVHIYCRSSSWSVSFFLSGNYGGLPTVSLCIIIICVHSITRYSFLQAISMYAVIVIIIEKKKAWRLSWCHFVDVVDWLSDTLRRSHDGRFH